MRIFFPLLFVVACTFTAPTPNQKSLPQESYEIGAALTPPASSSAPSTKPTSAPVTKPADKLPRTVIATLIDGERPIIPCGRMAFIGVYVYELDSVERGEPLSGKIVVDLLCPDFLQGKVKFKKGERHLLTLEGAKKSYAGAIAPKPPQEGLPRYEATSIKPAP